MRFNLDCNALSAISMYCTLRNLLASTFIAEPRILFHSIFKLCAVIVKCFNSVQFFASGRFTLICCMTDRDASAGSFAASASAEDANESELDGSCGSDTERRQEGIPSEWNSLTSNHQFNHQFNEQSALS